MLAWTNGSLAEGRPPRRLFLEADLRSYWSRRSEAGGRAAPPSRFPASRRLALSHTPRRPATAHYTHKNRRLS